MRTYEQRTQDVLEKVKKMKYRRATAATVAAVCAGVLALVLFLPFNTDPPSVRQYRNSPYYDLIQKINAATYKKPRYANNFEKLLSELTRNIVGVPMAPGAPAEGDDFLTNSPTTDINGDYQEVTDNQVAGVIEGDLIKRTDRHIFYLHSNSLSIYTIAGEESCLVGNYAPTFESDAGEIYYADREMFLSVDGKTVTLILPGFGDVLTRGKKEAFVCVLSLDVTDPQSIQETGRTYLTGSYLSSRMVDGKLLLISQFGISRNYSFDQPESYLPRYGTPGNMQCIAAADIIAPDTLSATQYTVVTLLDGHGLFVTDTTAFLSYSDELYVSKQNIYATRSYSLETKEADTLDQRNVTQITCVGYSGGTFTKEGSIVLDGSVKNQYSMDEYEGILRVVTSTNRLTYRNRIFEEYTSVILESTERNVNLYCVSLADWSVVASVIGFAPEGETAESVRFDGDTAYVCTAEVITMSDPVYYFDLSDLSNITWKDTGTIDGYSSSLVNFGDYLLGVGYNSARGLKIEIYRETESGVESVAVYERDCTFSEEYKSYFIDRENQMIGLGISDHGKNGGRYILLQFDGYQLRTLAESRLNGPNQWKRGVVIDGGLYLFGDSEEFRFLDIEKWQYQNSLYEKLWGSQ